MSSKRLKNIKKEFQFTESMSAESSAKKISEYGLSNLKAKFDETVSLEFKLGIDGKRSDQMVKSSLALSNSHGRSMKVIIITNSSNTPSIDGCETLVINSSMLSSLASGKINIKKYSIALTSEPMMREIAASGCSKVLGMAGLMPNIKTGTVFKTDELLCSQAQKFIANTVEVKSDKFGYIKFPIGKASMTWETLLKNMSDATSFVPSLKPATFSGIFVKEVRLSTSMSGFCIKVA